MIMKIKDIKSDFLPHEIGLTDFMNFMKSQGLNVVGNEPYWLEEYKKYLDFRNLAQ